jgi:hypothetical protein
VDIQNTTKRMTWQNNSVTCVKESLSFICDLGVNGKEGIWGGIFVVKWCSSWMSQLKLSWPVLRYRVITL